MAPWLLFLTITLEGYVVLAAELLAIRQLSPYVGNSTDTVAIIIAAVLLPLAVGYHRGGQRIFKAGDPDGLRRLLSRNLLVAGVFLAAGFCHVHVGIFFEALYAMGMDNRVAQTTLYALLFLVYPVYLLGQTVPLASQALPKDSLARLTGRMLFFSTFGSFVGSIVSTLVLMTWLGVHTTFTITFLLLMVLVILLGHGVRREYSFAALLLLAYVCLVNGDPVLRKLHIVQNNAYNQVAVLPEAYGDRIFSVNNSPSSRLTADPDKRFKYIAYIERQLEVYLPKDRPADILVIGAGGFTLGLEDTRNQYTYLDIDPALKETAEKSFLGRELEGNKLFVAMSARPFLKTAAQTFDVIIIDAYTNRFTIPADLVTEEFFAEVKAHLKPGGMMMANVIASPAFKTRFSRTIDATMRRVFPYMDRTPLEYNRKLEVGNVIYTWHQPEDARPQPLARPYTDLLNRYFLDK